TPFLEDYEQLLIRFGTDYLNVRHDRIDHAQLKKFFEPWGYREAALPIAQHLDFDGIRSRLMSSSYVPQHGDERCEPMLVMLRELFDRHQRDERVSLLYQTQLYWGRLT